jgi:hydroxymethylglutaryl-CoA reductase
MEDELFINFLNRQDILKSLAKLTTSSKPYFGIMTAQLMVEHLAINVQFSNGKNPLVGYRDISPMKSFLLSNQPMPVGTAFFLTGRKLAEPITENLNVAILLLTKEMDVFEIFFDKSPSRNPTHAVFGNLTKEEWALAHSKHFTHHFKQFGIY